MAPPSDPARGGVIVTGAGKGIGRETAVRLAAQGWRVTAISRSEADLLTLAARIGCAVIACDLSDAGAARLAARRALAECPVPVTGLVNCAGIVRLSSFIDTDPDDFQATLAVNTVAPMVLAQEVVRRWLTDGRAGSIVNVSSLAARVGTPLHAAYCASKAALDALTRVMAVELGGHGIRVNSVNPVVTMTPMGREAWRDPLRADPMRARIPLGRFAEAGEVAAVIGFLLGDGAAMIHGSCVDVDGGFRAG